MKPEVISRIEAIYARIPKLACKRKCQDCCGPIAVFKPEFDHMCAYSGMVPPTKPTTMLSEGGANYGDAVLLDGGPCLTCPFLNPHTGQCEVYEVRPLICRLWGVVKSMRCPFGCVPERWLSDKESHELLYALETIER